MLHVTPGRASAVALYYYPGSFLYRTPSRFAASIHSGAHETTSTHSHCQNRGEEQRCKYTSKMRARLNCTRLGIGFPLVSCEPVTAAVRKGTPSQVYPRRGLHQWASADLFLIAAAGQGTVGVRQLLRVRIQDVGAPAFTSILQAGERVTATKGEALLDGH